MRAMSVASGVPIEPEEQTRLLDACASGAGVVGGGVPGGELCAGVKTDVQLEDTMLSGFSRSIRQEQSQQLRASGRHGRKCLYAHYPLGRVMAGYGGKPGPYQAWKLPCSACGRRASRMHHHNFRTSLDCFQCHRLLQILDPGSLRALPHQSPCREKRLTGGREILWTSARVIGELDDAKTSWSVMALRSVPSLQWPTGVLFKHGSVDGINAIHA